jgi:hypothetical protein
MAGRLGGTLFVAVNGVRLSVKGNWTINPGRPKRDAVVGADQVHGYKELPQVPSIEGEASVTPDLDLPALLDARDVTVTAELANGQVAVLRDAWQAAEGAMGTEEANVPLRFEGLSMDMPPAS